MKVFNEHKQFTSDGQSSKPIQQITPGDFSKKIRSWTLKGCWLKSISEGNFTHADNGLRSIDATIVYDRAIPVIDKTVTE